MKYECIQCGKEFTSYNPAPKFCSLGCKGISQRESIDEQKAMDLYSSGMTQEEVACELKTTRKVIEDIFKRNRFKCRKAAKRNQFGENNHTWSGNNPSYKAAHKRLTRKFGSPSRCEQCGTTDPSKHYDWANLTGNYADILDYKRMCRSCHRIFDNSKAK